MTSVPATSAATASYTCRRNTSSPPWWNGRPSGYAAHDPVGRGLGNSRNGSYSKAVTTEVGQVELAVSRGVV
jgi:hypothetical protein